MLAGDSPHLISLIISLHTIKMRVTSITMHDYCSEDGATGDAADAMLLLQTTMPFSPQQIQVFHTPVKIR